MNPLRRFARTFGKPILISTIIMLGMAMTFGSAGAEDLDKVKQAGELKIALTGAYPPFSMINEQNEVVGFDVSVGKEIAKRMGLKPVIITTAWDGIIAGLLSNKFDTIVGSMSITPPRQKMVDFVGPYYSAGRAVFVMKTSKIMALDDLKGKTIGVTLGETHEKWARKKQGDMKWKIKTYKGLPELLLELEHSRIDAMIIDSVPGKVAITKDNRPLRMIDTPNIEGNKVDVGIAIRKKNPKLAAAMQEALDAMMSDGTYKKIALEWVGADIR